MRSPFSRKRSSNLLMRSSSLLMRSSSLRNEFRISAARRDCGSNDYPCVRSHVEFSFVAARLDPPGPLPAELAGGFSTGAVYLSDRDGRGAYCAIGQDTGTTWSTTGTGVAHPAPSPRPTPADTELRHSSVPARRCRSAPSIEDARRGSDHHASWTLPRSSEGDSWRERKERHRVAFLVTRCTGERVKLGLCARDPMAKRHRARICPRRTSHRVGGSSRFATDRRSDSQRITRGCAGCPVRYSTRCRSSRSPAGVTSSEPPLDGPGASSGSAVLVQISRPAVLGQEAFDHLAGGCEPRKTESPAPRPPPRLDPRVFSERAASRARPRMSRVVVVAVP